MDVPPVQYVTAPRGHKIAYAVSGHGRPMVVCGPALGGMAHLWRFFPDWVDALSSRFQLIQYDLHGHGMSDRGLPDDHSLRDGDDLPAVLDRLQVERSILFGLSGVGHVAVRFAVSHPEQVEALILLNTGASVAMPSFYRDLPAENWEFFLRSLVPRSLDEDEAQAWFDSLHSSTDFRDWCIRGRVVSASDISSELPLLRVPTLVLVVRSNPLASIEAAKELAARTPHSSLVLIDGASPLGDASQGVRAIDAFLEGLPASARFKEARGSGPADARGASASSQGLSPREVEILRLIAAGKRNREIARDLVISDSTVAKHVSSILSKTASGNRAEATTFAHTHHLV